MTTAGGALFIAAVNVALIGALIGGDTVYRAWRRRFSHPSVHIPEQRIDLTQYEARTCTREG